MFFNFKKNWLIAYIQKSIGLFFFFNFIWHQSSLSDCWSPWEWFSLLPCLLISPPVTPAPLCCQLLISSISFLEQCPFPVWGPGFLECSRLWCLDFQEKLRQAASWDLLEPVSASSFLLDVSLLWVSISFLLLLCLIVIAFSLGNLSQPLWVEKFPDGDRYQRMVGIAHLLSCVMELCCRTAAMSRRPLCSCEEKGASCQRHLWTMDLAPSTQWHWTEFCDKS